MAWYVDEYIKIIGKMDFGVVTAKPDIMWGLKARVISTGYGVAVVSREAAKKLLGGLEGKTVAVQGFGNVGSYTAKFLSEWGARVVAVSDSKGGIYNSKGLNIEEVMKVKRETGSVINYKNIEKHITNEELLELDVDILVPAAVEGVITKDNAPRIKAKIIVEGANGPVTPEADEILFKRGVFIAPDILANAGGVTMSWIEWVNNRMGGWLTEEDAMRKLDQKMMNAFHKFYDYTQKHSDVDYRTAAQALAIERVVNAMKLRGWI